MAHNRRKSNGRYIVPKKEIRRLIEGNRKPATIQLQVQSASGFQREYNANFIRITHVLYMITQFTFQETLQMKIVIEKPFTRPKHFVIWEGNQIMQDLYTLNQL